MANRNFLSNKLYQLEAYPVHLTAKFTVDDTNGAGITTLTGAGIRNVFMHTATTPSTGNPNPAAGVIMVQLQDCYSKLLQAAALAQAPLTGSNLTSVTNHTLYQITALGTATTAQWVAKGLPVGVTPAVGAAFVATATGTIGGSATVKAIGSSGLSGIELVGVTNNQNAVNPAAPSTQGMYLFFQCRSSTPTGTISTPTLTMDPYTPAGTNDGSSPPIFTGTPATLTGTISTPTFTGAASALAAPAAGTIITLDLWLSNSSVTVQGQ